VDVGVFKLYRIHTLLMISLTQDCLHNNDYLADVDEFRPEVTCLFQSFIRFGLNSHRPVDIILFLMNMVSGGCCKSHAPELTLNRSCPLGSA